MPLTTPALLFPAISLLLLAYTNRFIVIAQLIRALVQQKESANRGSMFRQLDHLRLRIKLIRRMQLSGIASFIFCTLAMIALLVDQQLVGTITFGLSLVFLLLSLAYCFYEVNISGFALNVQLEELEKWRR